MSEKQAKEIERLLDATIKSLAEIRRLREENDRLKAKLAVTKSTANGHTPDLYDITLLRLREENERYRKALESIFVIHGIKQAGIALGTIKDDDATASASS